MVAYGESPYIYGFHDRGGENVLTHNGQAKGWVLVTEELRANPNDTGGRSYYKELADRGFGVIVRLNHAYGPDGTIPLEAKHRDFAQRVANFVRNSPGAHIWIIGNEMNFEREQPRSSPGNSQAEPITPRRYAECYIACRRAIKSLPGHEKDQVVVGAIGPWNAETPYEADPKGKYPANKIAGGPGHYPYHGSFGDFIKYFRDLLLAIGRQNCDAIAIHAYSHGYDPNLVFSDEKMGPPFQNYHYHFRTYQDQMNIIPAAFRDLPVYLTEANGDANPDGSKWPDVNSGWIKNAYKEINDWNKAGKQQIRCVILYRWSRDDDWHIDGKGQVHRDMQEAIARNYQWNPAVKPATSSQPATSPASSTQPTTATGDRVITTPAGLRIENIADLLPTNSAIEAYPTRPKGSIKRIIIHHTATPATVTPQRIAEFQIKSRPAITYHYCVMADGKVYQTEPLTTTSAHAGNHSTDSVGIGLIGNFTEDNPPGSQLAAAAGLIGYLVNELNLVADTSTIFGYSDLVPTGSPGATWSTWKTLLINQARELARAAAAESTTPATTSTAPSTSTPVTSASSDEEPGYLARYLEHNTPQQMAASQTLTFDLTLLNDGTFTWQAGGANPFHLGFKWYDTMAEVLKFPPQYDFRTTLPRNVPPGGTIKLQARLRTPDATGTHHLFWDMVHENVTWFRDQGDPGLLVSKVSITPATTAAPTPAPTPTVTTPTPVTVGTIQIQNISATLPTNSNVAPYPTRAVNTIRRFVLNHTATPATVTPQRIAQFQVENEKFPRAGIAYHYCVTADGIVYQTQPLTVISNHAGNHSTDSVGICLIGNFTEHSPPGKQITATATVIAQIGSQLGIATTAATIFGYSDLVATASPGATWPAWKNGLIAQATTLRGSVTATPTTAPQPTTSQPSVSLPTGKTIEHYLLFWHRGGDNWAEWDLVSAIDYIGKFKPTVGFSIDQAKVAKYVTIVGGPGGVSAEIEQALRTAGCQVDRLNGATQEETNQMLYQLVAAERRFRSFSG